METKAPTSALSAREADVLAHTSLNGRYVTDETDVIALAARGLLRDHGPQPIADGMHYLTMTAAGRDALNDYHLAQPKPAPVKKRRRSRAFECWMRHREANYDRGFQRFLKDIWPTEKCRIFA